MSYLLYYLIPVAAILLVVFVTMSVIKKKDYKWIFLFCLGLTPLFMVLLMAIHSYFHGTGLVGSKGGTSDAIFVLVLFCVRFWYIIVPALFLTIVAAIKVFNKPKK